MREQKLNRRDWLQRLAVRFATWSPLLGLCGVRFCRYAQTAAGYRGWLEICGRCIGYVETSGRIVWSHMLR